MDLGFPNPDHDKKPRPKIEAHEPTLGSADDPMPDGFIERMIATSHKAREAAMGPTAPTPPTPPEPPLPPRPELSEEGPNDIRFTLGVITDVAVRDLAVIVNPDGEPSSATMDGLRDGLKQVLIDELSGEAWNLGIEPMELEGADDAKLATVRAELRRRAADLESPGAKLADHALSAAEADNFPAAVKQTRTLMSVNNVRHEAADPMLANRVANHVEKLAASNELTAATAIVNMDNVVTSVASAREAFWNSAAAVPGAVDRHFAMGQVEAAKGQLDRIIGAARTALDSIEGNPSFTDRRPASAAFDLTEIATDAERHLNALHDSIAPLFTGSGDPGLIEPELETVPVLPDRPMTPEGTDPLIDDPHGALLALQAEDPLDIIKDQSERLTNPLLSIAPRVAPGEMEAVADLYFPSLEPYALRFREGESLERQLTAPPVIRSYLSRVRVDGREPELGRALDRVLDAVDAVSNRMSKGSRVAHDPYASDNPVYQDHITTVVDVARPAVLALDRVMRELEASANQLTGVEQHRLARDGLQLLVSARDATVASIVGDPWLRRLLHERLLGGALPPPEAATIELNRVLYNEQHVAVATDVLARFPEGTEFADKKAVSTMEARVHTLSDLVEGAKPGPEVNLSTLQSQILDVAGQIFNAHYAHEPIPPAVTDAFRDCVSQSTTVELYPVVGNSHAEAMRSHLEFRFPAGGRDGWSPGGPGLPERGVGVHRSPFTWRTLGKQPQSLVSRLV